MTADGLLPPLRIGEERRLKIGEEEVTGALSAAFVAAFCMDPIGAL